jgi:hypothetical protein
MTPVPFREGAVQQARIKTVSEPPATRRDGWECIAALSRAILPKPESNKGVEGRQL